MRTIRVELSSPLPGGSPFTASPTVTLSTEAIIADDADASDAGREAREALDLFIAGYLEEGS